MNIRHIALLAAGTLTLTAARAVELARIASPDGRLAFTLQAADTTGKGSPLTYTVTFDSHTVIEPSALGLRFDDRNGTGSWNAIPNIKKITLSKTEAHDSVWRPVYGEQAEYRDRYNQFRVSFPGSQVQLCVRAYNEGIAFRYEIPNEDLILKIGGELTQFNFPDSARGWINSHPQAVCERRKLEKLQTEMPLTVELPDGRYAAVLEAGLANYARARLRAGEKAGKLHIALDSPVVTGSPARSPWRVVMAADKPTELLQNNGLILNLNEPCALASTDWIRPGKVIREVTLNTKTAKECVDFAAERGIQYIHFDAGWYGHEYVQASDATTVDVDPDRNPVNDLNLLEVIRYAKAKDIGVILYVNRRQLEKNMDVIFSLYRSWGVAGVKFGFVNTGTHHWVEWVNEAVRKAADNGLIVNIHDEYRPTGLSRTWPNLLTQEGIRGNEEMPDANHNTALPFTRYLSGAGDYTYCYYTRKELGHEKRHVQNTPAHQLALPVVYYSPLQYIYWYDKPTDYRGEPELEFWKAMPTVWNRTVVLDGRIGGYASVARQAANGDWFVGTITNKEGRTLTLALDFLEKGKKYRLTRYADGTATIPTRTKVGVTTQTVRGGDRIGLTLKPSGGEAWHITAIE